MKRFQQTRPKFLAAVAFLTLCGLSGGVFAAQGGTPGKPGGSESPDLGDIVILYRDADGLPIPTPVTQVIDPESGQLVDAGLCQQPIGFPSDTCPLKCANPTEPCLVPVDPLTCGVEVGYETCTREVDFGRTSVVRSPVVVLEQALEEAVSKLATAQCTTLDPAGRLVNTSEIDGEILSATIDSPLENLAIYRQLMLTGDLGALIELPDPNVLNMAARGVGAAADKAGNVTVDQVVYLNQIMGLSDQNVQTYLPKKCVAVREEVQGTVRLVDKCVLDFGPTGGNYAYTRLTNFAELPAPPYIPSGAPEAGGFEYLGLWSEADETEPNLFYVVQGPILDSVFCVDSEGLPVPPVGGVCPTDIIAPGFTDGNVGGFAQAADDTREVIEFMHDRPIPLGYETAVPLCDDPNQAAIYDVSISGDSGLQVPVRMVIGTEGREVIVTVANAGPDTATGTVTVVGIATNGSTVFSEAEPFELNGGTSQSWTWMFSINYATTVTWTATAVPDCDTCDLNTANNSVIETTIVTGRGGGGDQGNNPNR